MQIIEGLDALEKQDGEILGLISETGKDGDRCKEEAFKQVGWDKLHLTALELAH